MADKKNEKTEYVVLVETQTGTWDAIGNVQASSAGMAKRQGLAMYRPEGGTVVAVPSRSWEPEDLKPKLSFG